MGRRATVRPKHWPDRMELRRGTFYYAFMVDGGRRWQKLSKDETTAIEAATAMNAMKREQRLVALSGLRFADEELRQMVMARDGFKCVYCGRAESLGVDHFIPTSDGGVSMRWNLVTSCSSCNTAKSDGPIGALLAEISGARDLIVRGVLSAICGNIAAIADKR